MQKKTVVLASGNKGKCRELGAALDDLGWDLRPQSQWSVSSIEETGLTFVENAILKARHAAQKTGFSALADDSGLVVPALGGRPGIYSARYAGEDADYPTKMQSLLGEFNETRSDDRRAYFYCVLVWLRHAEDPVPVVAEGKWWGELAEAPCGEQGFGYDPIFWCPEHDCSAAELSVAQKSDCSHRGKAVKKLIQQL